MSESQTLAAIASAMDCTPDDHADLVEAVRILVRERDEAMAKSSEAGTVRVALPGPWKIIGTPGDGSAQWQAIVDATVAHRDGEWIAAIRKSGAEIERQVSGEGTK